MNVYRPEERRLVLRLMAYWDDLRGDRAFPSATEIDPAAVGDDWPFCCVLALAEPLEASTFEHVGPELLGAGGAAADGLRLDAVPEDVLLRPALGYLTRVLRKRVPMSLGGEARLAAGPALYRSILLPLSDDGEAIDRVLGAANARLVAAEEPSGPAAGSAEGANG